MDVQINSSELVGAGILVTASVRHTNVNEMEPKEIAARLQHLSKNAMYVLAGSFNVIDSGPRRSIIRGFMIPAKNTVPFNENTKGFNCLSSSVYQDEKEAIWNLHRSEHGQYLVRAATIEDPTELLELMQSCSSAIPRGTDREFFRAQASAEVESANFEMGDYIQYQQEGEIRFGFALAAVEDDESENAIAVVVPSTNILDVIDSKQVVGVAPQGYQIEGVACVIDDHMRSLSATSDNNKLIEYYKKVYGHNMTYWNALENILANHRFM